MSMFHEGHRTLQDRYGGRVIADRLEANRRRDAFIPEDIELIESVPAFFLATAANGTVDCSIKGGMPGFVRVTGPNTLAFPDYDGNRMYRTLGNIQASPSVGLLFVRFDGTSTKLRVNGQAVIDESPEAIEGIVGAKRLVRVTADHIFPNCPRYVPAMGGAEPSVYAPRPDYTPPTPEWKTRDYIRDVLDET